MDHDASSNGLSGAYGFVSHSSRDREIVRRLCEHLLPAAHAELGVEFWVDDSTAAGERWNEEMSDVLAQSNIFVLCMSAEYFASEFVYNAELPTIYKKCRTSNGLIVPVVLKRCSWWGFVGDLQVVPTRNGRVVPISDWRPQYNGYHEASIQIIRGIREHFRVRATQDEQSERRIEDTSPRVIQPAPPGPHRVSPNDIDRAVKTVIARRAAKSGV